MKSKIEKVLYFRFARMNGVRSQDGQNKNIDLIFEYIDRLQDRLETPTLPERKQIGYEIGEKK